MAGRLLLRSRKPLKKLQERVEQLRKEHHGKQIKIWAEDEARIGLQPVIRRQWCKIGSKPRAVHRIQYQWIYVYGFVNPATGETHWLFLPSVSCKLTERALESFALQYGDKNKIILLLWDQAGFHQTANMQLPAGIEIFSLPPYTPELQPAERLWPSLQEAVINRWVRTLDHLESLLTDRIQALIKTPEIIRLLTGFSWILSALNATS